MGDRSTSTHDKYHHQHKLISPFSRSNANILKQQQGLKEEASDLQYSPMDLVSESANNSTSSSYDNEILVVSSSTTTTDPTTASSSANNNTPSRYENQKRRDWNTFCQYLRNHIPPLSMALCSGAHVLEFLHYLDQFGKTKVHNPLCPFFGLPNPPGPCPCPLRQAWGSLDALIGRLRAAYEENGGRPESNPFGARAVRIYLRDVRDFQAKARGVSYEKKRKRPKPKPKMNDSNSTTSPNDI